MVKIIESKWIELIVVLLFFGLKGLNILNPQWDTAGLEISFKILLALYLVRTLISFRHWKLSKGISVINAYLNFQTCYAVMAIGFTFLMFPGYSLLTYYAMMGPQIFCVIMAIFLAVRWKKINKQVYWSYLKWNVARACVATVICTVLFYTLDMSVDFNR